MSFLFSFWHKLQNAKNEVKNVKNWEMFYKENIGGGEECYLWYYGKGDVAHCFAWRHTKDWQLASTPFCPNRLLSLCRGLLMCPPAIGSRSVGWGTQPPALLLPSQTGWEMPQPRKKTQFTCEDYKLTTKSLLGQRASMCLHRGPFPPPSITW